MRLSILLFTTLLLNCFFTNAQSDYGKKTHTKLVKARGDIYMLQSKGGNIGLSFGQDGVFMIDDQFAEATPDVLDDIKRMSKKEVQFLVNTHFHPDHTGGNINMAKEGAIIFSHENVRKRLQEGRRTANGRVDAKILPVVTFSEDLTFHYNGEKILVFHVHNAHTDGDAMVYFTKSNVIHAGDVLFNGKYPFIDIENGGSLAGTMNALTKLSALCNNETKIIPGHGDIATLKEINETLNMLDILRKRVNYYYLNKKTEDEVAAMRDFTERFDTKGYGDGFISTEKILRTIYKEVVNQQVDKKPMTEQEMQTERKRKKQERDNKKNEASTNEKKG